MSSARDLMHPVGVALTMRLCVHVKLSFWRLAVASPKHALSARMLSPDPMLLALRMAHYGASLWAECYTTRDSLLPLRTSWLRPCHAPALPQKPSSFSGLHESWKQPAPQATLLSKVANGQRRPPVILEGCKSTHAMAASTRSSFAIALPRMAGSHRSSSKLSRIVTWQSPWMPRMLRPICDVPSFDCGRESGTLPLTILRSPSETILTVLSASRQPGASSNFVPVADSRGFRARVAPQVVIMARHALKPAPAVEGTAAAPAPCQDETRHHRQAPLRSVSAVIMKFLASVYMPSLQR
mmetsp:Transcript_17555/g.53061  ORF Transcript_17555/g.53061 Transcript_17555/m.53061 type:complete len:297 (-) Transcript_17555:681-1571(-)